MKQNGNTEERERDGKTYSDLCACCGEDVPEGRQVCPICEHVAHGYQWKPPKKRLREKLRDALRALKG